MLLVVKDFQNWVNAKLEEKGWSQSELARRSGISQQTISRVLSGLRRPTDKFCKSIARAFGLPEEQVFRHAGLLPPIADEKKGLLQFLYDEAASMDVEQIKQFIEMVRATKRLNEGKKSKK